MHLDAVVLMCVYSWFVSIGMAVVYLQGPITSAEKPGGSCPKEEEEARKASQNKKEEHCEDQDRKMIEKRKRNTDEQHE